jgi:cytochrome b involved in lipid metabolism
MMHASLVALLRRTRAVILLMMQFLVAPTQEAEGGVVTNSQGGNIHLYLVDVGYCKASHFSVHAFAGRLIQQLVDLLKHCVTHEALRFAGLVAGMDKGGYISMVEVKKHNTMEDGWSVINSVVYHMTPYLRFHPGGAEILKAAMGKDATRLFHKYHSWVNVVALMDRCMIGPLERPAVSSS